MKPDEPSYPNPTNIQPHLKWHGARVTFLALFLIALFRVKTVKLAELAMAFIGNAKAESHYKRLQRFLGQFEINYYSLAQLVIQTLQIPTLDNSVA